MVIDGWMRANTAMKLAGIAWILYVRRPIPEMYKIVQNCRLGSVRFRLKKTRYSPAS